MSHITLLSTFIIYLSLSSEWSLVHFQHGFTFIPYAALAKTYPEDIGDCSLVRGFESYESYAVIQGSVAQDAGTKYSILGDVAGGVNTGKNICQTLLDSLGIAIPDASLDAWILHHWWQIHRTRKQLTLLLIYSFCLYESRQNISTIVIFFLSLPGFSHSLDFKNKASGRLNLAYFENANWGVLPLPHPCHFL